MFFSSSKQQLLVLILFLLLAIISVEQVILRGGWPANHEFDSFFVRTYVYAQHLLQHDWFPIWSSLDNSGYGSPQPALYHKTFYLLAGHLFNLVGDMKTSVLVTVIFFLTAGAMGMFQLAKQLELPDSLAMCSGIMLIFVNYTVTDWLIRAAMGEIAGYMLVPWVLAGFLQSLRHEKISILFAISLALCFLGHSVLAYFLVLILVVTGVILLISRQISINLLSPASIIPALVVYLVMTGPYLYAMAVLGKDYDMKRIVPASYLPENNVIPFLRYLWDTRWSFGEQWERYTVQLDMTLLLLLIFALCCMVFRCSRKAKLWHVDITPLQHQSTFGLFLIALFAVYLQTKWSIPFYLNMPGAVFLQFPWRLLAIISPVLIILAVFSMYALFVSKLAKCIIYISALFLGVTSGAFVPLQYSQLQNPSFKAHDLSLDKVKFSAFGEYVPQRAGVKPPFSTQALQQLMLDEGCAWHEQPTARENLFRQFKVVCRKNVTVVFPLFSSLYHQVIINEQKNKPLACLERGDYSGLCSVALDQGEYKVSIYLPTFGVLFSYRQMLANMFDG